MFEIIGWIGSILFAACAIPQAWMCYKQKHAHGLSWGLLMMWFWGEILTFIYVLPSGKIPLLVNYVFNFLLLLVIIYYKKYPKTAPL
jgi:uncharacterized protein with PQ loop repeat